MNLQKILEHYVDNYRLEPNDPNVYSYYDRPILFKFEHDSQWYLSQLINDSAETEETLVIKTSKEKLDLLENGGLLLYRMYSEADELIVFKKNKLASFGEPMFTISFYDPREIPSDYLPSKNIDMFSKGPTHVYIWIDFESEGLNTELHQPLSLAFVATDFCGEYLRGPKHYLIKNETYNCTSGAFRVHKKKGLPKVNF